MRSPRRVKVGQGAGEVLLGRHEKVLGRAGGSLDRRGLNGADRRVGYIDAMNADCFGAAQHRAEVLGILERVEHEHEWRLARAFAAARICSMSAGGRGLATSAMPWWPSKPASRSERAALQLHDRDAERGGVDDQLVERGAAFGDNQQTDGFAARRECLFDGATTGDQLLFLAEQRPCRSGLSCAARRAVRKRPGEVSGWPTGRPSGRGPSRCLAELPPGAVYGRRPLAVPAGTA